MADTIYDMVIIGGGPGGYTTAIRAGQYGLKVALVEREKKLGGTCLHWGCIPTKSLLFDAELYDHMKSATEHGMEGVGKVTINWKTILDRKNGIITKHVKGLDFLMRKNKVTTVEGFGRLTGAAKDGVHSVSVEGSNGEKKTVLAKNVVVATGSDARMLPGVEGDGTSILTNMGNSRPAADPQIHGGDRCWSGGGRVRLNLQELRLRDHDRGIPAAHGAQRR